MGQREDAGEVGEIQLIDVEAAQAFADFQTIDRVGGRLREILAAIGTGEEYVESFLRLRE